MKKQSVSCYNFVGKAQLSERYLASRCLQFDKTLSLILCFENESGRYSIVSELKEGLKLQTRVFNHQIKTVCAQACKFGLF